MLGGPQVFFAIVLSAMGVAQSAGLAPDLVTVQTAVNSIFRILDRQSAIDPDAPGKSLEAPQGIVEFQDVHFSYPLRPDIKIFQGLTFTIPTGQVLGGFRTASTRGSAFLLYHELPLPCFLSSAGLRCELRAGALCFHPWHDLHGCFLVS